MHHTEPTTHTEYYLFYLCVRCGLCAKDLTIKTVIMKNSHIISVIWHVEM